MNEFQVLTNLILLWLEKNHNDVYNFARFNVYKGPGADVIEFGDHKDMMIYYHVRERNLNHKVSIWNGDVKTNIKKRVIYLNPEDPEFFEKIEKHYVLRHPK